MPARGSLALALIIAALAPITTPARAEEPLIRRLKVSTGYHYSTGTYGGSDTTEMMYVPVNVRADIRLWSLQLTVPYLSIRGPATTVEGPSGPIRTNDGKSDGLGDILAQASYTIPANRSWLPFVELIGKVKFPTADRGAGLGTGEFDFGVESELSWVIGPWTPFAALGYRFLGDPPGAPLNDTLLASAGLLYGIADRLNVGSLIDYREASSASSAQRLEVVPFGSWRVTPQWSLDLYASAGLSDGSPDAGTGVQLGWTW